MELQIDISKPLLTQFSDQLPGQLNQEKLTLDPSMGKGIITPYHLPGSIELFYFSFTLHVDVSLSSQNDLESEWLLLNVNLSNTSLEKKVNDQAILFQKRLPAGMLFYPPGTTVQSSNPIGQPMEILLIRFPKNLLVQYMGDNQSLLENMTYSPIYEDLDYQTEQLIRKALRSSKSPFIQHASVLEILGIFFNKITNREHRKAVNKLHPEDVKALFLAASKLRDPLAKELPSVEVLASMAGMGITKFKQSFKQVFGTPPIRYHQKIKLEYAQNELLAKRKTASELSYELGYSHPSKFTVAYKKFFGTLPSQI